MDTKKVISMLAIAFFCFSLTVPVFAAASQYPEAEGTYAKPQFDREGQYDVVQTIRAQVFKDRNPEYFPFYRDLFTGGSRGGLHDRALIFAATGGVTGAGINDRYFCVIIPDGDTVEIVENPKGYAAIWKKPTNVLVISRVSSSELTVSVVAPEGTTKVIQFSYLVTDNYFRTTGQTPEAYTGKYDYYLKNEKPIVFRDDIVELPTATPRPTSSPVLPPVIPSGDQYVPYDAQRVWTDVVMYVQGNFGSAGAIGLLIMVVVIGIPAIINVIRYFSKGRHNG